jgi:hypothetical protein
MRKYCITLNIMYLRHIIHVVSKGQVYYAMLSRHGYSLTFLASGSPASAAESSLSSLSYPPNTPSAGAGVGAERFLLVSDVAGALGIVAVVAAIEPFVNAGVAGAGVAVSSGVAFDSDGDFESLTLLSFFFITPLSRDLTVFFGGVVAVFDCLVAEGCEEGFDARPGC